MRIYCFLLRGVHALLKINKIYNIDCLDGLKEIDEKSLDFIDDR